MNPYLGIALGIIIAFVSGIIASQCGMNHTRSSRQRWFLSILVTVGSGIVYSLVFPEMGVLKPVTFLCPWILGAVVIQCYWILMYVRSSEGEDEAANHQVVSLYLGWKFRNRPYQSEGFINQTSHPRNKPGIV